MDTQEMAAQLAERDAHIRHLEATLRNSAAGTRVADMEGEMRRMQATSDKIIRQVKNERDQSRRDAAEKIKKLEAQIKQLEDEVRQLGGTPPVASPSSTHTSTVPTTPESASKTDDGKVVLTRTMVENGERRYQLLKDELLRKKVENEELSARVKDLQPGAQVLSDNVVVNMWDSLRSAVRLLTLERFNETQPSPSELPAKDKEKLSHLSTNYYTYLTTEQTPCYLFRAMIWRQLYDHLFNDLGLAWGEQVRDSFTIMSDTLNMTGQLGHAQYLDWRVHTGRAIHTAFAIDEAVVDTITTKMYNFMMRFASDGDMGALKSSIRDIVKLAAEMNAVFARTKAIPLMSNEPSSKLTNGFDLNERTMDMKGKLFKDGVVDLMVTPCLLRWDGDDYALLVKADVVC